MPNNLLFQAENLITSSTVTSFIYLRFIAEHDSKLPEKLIDIATLALAAEDAVMTEKSLKSNKLLLKALQCFSLISV